MPKRPRAFLPVTLTKDMESRILAEQSHIKGLCRRMLYSFPNREDLVEDLAQETLIKAIRFAQEYRSEATVSSWVYSIAHNVVCDFLRKKKRTFSSFTIQANDSCENEDDVSAGVNPVDFISENHSEGRLIVSLDAERVRKRFSCLRLVQTSILNKRLDEDLTFEEIACLQGIPISTVKRRYYDAIRELRKLASKRAHLGRGERRIA